jgi:ankyrin repeat protein
MSDDVKFWEACETGDTDGATRLVKSIRDINKPNSKGWNAIILAAFNHHLTIVKLLLQHGADINSTNSNGTTVFMYAKTKVLANNNFYFLDFLIENGADIHRRDKKNNYTVLDYAKQLNHTKLIEYLKNKGAE